MASFPALFSGSVSLYPLTRGRRFPVAIQQWSDYSEQRWVQSAEVSRFQLTIDDVNATDKGSIVTFFEGRKGSFDATWDITIGGTTYNYLAFEDDELACTEATDGLWSIRVAAVQTRKN
jgi:hypothetical protein